MGKKQAAEQANAKLIQALLKKDAEKKKSLYKRKEEADGSSSYDRVSF
jgi:hypothetical protein